MYEYDTQATNTRDGCLHLERARDREGSSETAWCADYWRGECPGMEWWWRELKEANKPPCQLKCKKTAMKMDSFPLMTFF
jgi:hypothetical protein